MATGRIGASDLTGGANTTVYECPTDNYAVASINICNRGNQATSVRIAVADLATPTNGEYIEYDTEISGSVINKNLYSEINKLAPFGNENSLPIFLIKNVIIIKSGLVGYNHVKSVIKPTKGASINSICFNCANTKMGQYLLSYKKKINIIGQITENSFNNKKSIQLNIKDLFLSVN